MGKFRVVLFLSGRLQKNKRVKEPSLGKEEGQTEEGRMYEADKKKEIKKIK